jgi:hypothetical protein
VDVVPSVATADYTLETRVMDLQSLGKMLIILGATVVVVGTAFLLAGRVPFLGRLPGDFRIQRGNVGCYVPIATSIIISLILTVVLNLLARLLNK